MFHTQLNDQKTGHAIADITSNLAEMNIENEKDKSSEIGKETKEQSQKNLSEQEKPKKMSFFAVSRLYFTNQEKLITKIYSIHF